MAAQLFYMPFLPAFTSKGLPAGGASASFFYTGTTTAAPIFADSGLTTPLTNPVLADALGQLPNIYLDASTIYRVRILDAFGAQLGNDVDPYYPGQAVTIIPSLPQLVAPDGSSKVGFQQGDANASAITLQNKLATILNVEDFRYGTGGVARSDLLTLTYAFSAWLSRGGGKLTAGQNRIYNLGSKADTASIFTLQSGLANAEFDLNGSTITLASGGGVIFNVFDIGNYTNVVFRNGKLIDTGYVAGATAGAAWVTPQPGSQTCRGLTLDNVSVAGGVAALQPKGPSTNGRIAGIFIAPNCVFQNVYYGLNCQEQGDEITGGFTAVNPTRGYFAYGCSSHDLAINMRTDGAGITETLALVKRYTLNTTNIRLRIKFDGTIIARNAMVKIEHQNNDGASSVIDNVDVTINVAPTATDPNGVTRLGFRSYQTNGTENTGTSTHVTSNVRLAGDLVGVTTGILSFNAATTSGSAVITPSGLYAGQIMDYFPFGAAITGPGIPAGATVLSSDATTVTLTANATATASSASLARSAVHIRSHYTPSREVRIAFDPAIRGATPTMTSAYRGFAFRVARDREYRLYRGDLTTAPLAVDLSGFDNVSTSVNLGLTLVGNQSGAAAQDRTYFEFNVFLTVPAGGPLTVNTSPNPVNNSSGTAATFGGFAASGKVLQASVSGAAYALSTSYARIDTTYRDQVPA